MNFKGSPNTSLQQAKLRLIRKSTDNDELKKSYSKPIVHNANNMIRVDDYIKLREARGKLVASRPESSYIRLRSAEHQELGEVEQSQHVSSAASSNVLLPEQTIDSKASIWKKIQDIHQLSAIDMSETLITNFIPYPMTQIPNDQMLLANLNTISSEQGDDSQTKIDEVSLDTEANIPRERPTRKKIDFERYNKAEEERIQALYGNPVVDVLPYVDHAKDASVKLPPKKPKLKRTESLVMPTKSRAIKRAQNDNAKKSVLSKMNKSVNRKATDVQIESGINEVRNVMSKEKEDELKRFYQIKESSVCLLKECQPFFSPVSVIAFAKPVRSKFGVIIKCINGCTFQQTFKGINYMRETMSVHFTEHHQRQKWNGFCSTCLKYVFNPDEDKTRWKFSMMNEIEHIINFHITGLHRQA